MNGKAILYADHITDSMRKAIDETERRRAKQEAFNAEHGITPQGVQKRVADVMQAGDKPARGKQRKAKDAELPMAAEDAAEYKVDTPQQLAKALKKLEEKMFTHARNLEFEEAAAVRDQIDKLKASNFKVVA